MSDPSGSLKATRRASPLREICADNVGIPIVFSPPSVSALNVNVARYWSGSRAVIPASDSGALLVFVFALADSVFVLALVFALVLRLLLAGVQPVASEIKATASTK